MGLGFIPSPPKGRYTERTLKVAPDKGCTRETLSGVGELAFIETCEGYRAPAAYVKVGRNDLMVAADPEEGKPLASAKPGVMAVAKASVAKARTK